MKITQQSIDNFLAPKKLAIAGVPRDEKKFGYSIFKELGKKGFEVLPINPAAQNIGGKTCYPDVASLPAGIESLLIVTPKTETAGVVQSAIDYGIKNIWIQQMAETPEAIELAEKNGINLIYKECIFMFAEPTGIHKFHWWLKKIFGGLPK